MKRLNITAEVKAFCWFFFFFFWEFNTSARQFLQYGMISAKITNDDYNVYCGNDKDGHCLTDYLTLGLY
jgi:hypothetical protein